MKQTIAVLFLTACIVLSCTHYFAPEFVENIYRRYFRPDKSPYQTVGKATSLIRGDALKEPNYKPRITPLESRADPNRRLVHAFGINNAFTTTDEKYHKDFRHRVVDLLNKDQEWWNTAASLALTEARSDTDERIIMLVPYVQRVTFKVILYALFGTPKQESDSSEIENVTKLINSLWLTSKHSNSKLDRDRSLLETSLSHIVSQYEHPPEDNPLNVILPAYETMWRVVLRCWLEVSFRGGSGKTNLKSVLADYSTHPTASNFDDQSISGISCRWIVMEALRLYPPTRRIYRKTIGKGGKETKIEAADIEYLHRDRPFWGRDSFVFRPSRWQKFPHVQPKAFMAFGLGKFSCPARPDFGPRMIGVLVAALTVTFEDDWELQTDGITGDPRHGKAPLGLDREAMESWELYRQQTPCS